MSDKFIEWVRSTHQHSSYSQSSPDLIQLREPIVRELFERLARIESALEVESLAKALYRPTCACCFGKRWEDAGMLAKQDAYERAHAIRQAVGLEP